MLLATGEDGERRGAGAGHLPVSAAIRRRAGACGAAGLAWGVWAAPHPAAAGFGGAAALRGRGCEAWAWA